MSEQLGELALCIGIFLMSGVKFMVGVATSLAIGLSFWQQFVCTVGGGIAGSAFFTYLGEAVRRWIVRRRKHPPKPLSQRWLRFWTKYGLWGVAFLTPPILSPPVGTAIALAFGTPRRVLLTRLAIAMITWGLVFSFLGEGMREVIGVLGG